MRITPPTGDLLLFNCNNCRKLVQQLDEHCRECGRHLPMFSTVEKGIHVMGDKPYLSAYDVT